MRWEDPTQDTAARLRLIQLIVLGFFIVFLFRLLYLQVLNTDYYSEQAINQRLRVLSIPAPRGTIFDRYGRVLADSPPVYNVLLQRQPGVTLDLDRISRALPPVLEIDSAYLEEKLDHLRERRATESVVIKENATLADIAWVEAHTLEFPTLNIEQQPRRRYPHKGLLAHVLGYVGQISSQQLESPQFKDHGYKSGDIIGKEGLEATYDQFLRGRDGNRTVIVDSLGRVKDTIKITPPIPGQNLITTIDIDLQLAAEEQLQSSPSQRGVIVAMVPNNGEILALASFPTFDPNLFTERISTKQGRAEYSALLRNPDTPLYNRAIRGRYPPGSTWKVPMAVAALQQGVITLDDSRLACGGGIQIGNKFTRCMGNHRWPDVHTAIVKSCDGYFYRLGLRMGLAGIERMVEEFKLDEPTGIDLPHELTSWTPSAEFKARFNPNAAAWSDIDTVYASIGQVYEFVTPVSLLRAIAAVGVGGRLYRPHLLKEISPRGEMNGDNYRPASNYGDALVGTVTATREDDAAIVNAMWSVVNEAGTAAAISKSEYAIAGKTGTAQVVGLGKDIGKNKDHSWFVSYAPAFEPQISVLALIENAGFGSRYAAPAARAIYDAYFAKRESFTTVTEQLAKTENSTDKPNR